MKSLSGILCKEWYAYIYILLLLIYYINNSINDYKWEKFLRLKTELRVFPNEMFVGEKRSTWGQHEVNMSDISSTHGKIYIRKLESKTKYLEDSCLWLSDWKY